MPFRTALPLCFAKSLMRRASTVHWKATVSALALATAAHVMPAMAQETAGQINGYISNAAGAALGGAQVRIVHTPSGTTTTVTTNADGRFIARGLRLGGPYEVTVTAPGGSTEKIEENVFVVLGEPYQLSYGVGTKIEEVLVSATRQRELQTGSVMQFDREQIASIPTISRDLKDVIRIDPKVYVDRFNSDAIQIAGTNNRFNLLTIDGVRQNDDFGLNNNGYPTLRSPLSLDVIEQLSVNTAPFAVTYSGFQGGNVNVVTKSGTNEFHGSGYFYYTDDSLIGSSSGNRRVGPFVFTDKTFGATLGGPIVKDKLFFFAGYERFTTANPVTRGPLGAGFTNSVNEISQADYNQIKQIAQSVYGYDILDLPTSLPEKDEKIFAKLTWNVSDDHRAIVSYNRTKGNAVISPGPVSLVSAVSTLGAGSNWYDNIQKVDSVSVQVFSDWSDALKTEVKYGYKKQSAAPTPLGNRPFAEMQVRTAAGGVLAFGPDRFGHFNSLSNSLHNIKIKADYLWGDHTLTAGYEREMLDVFNAFIQDSFGTYYFASIADFQARRATQLTYQNAVTNVQSDGAAQFKSDTDAFYIQDSWQALDSLTVLAGLRYERYSSSSVPRANALFLGRHGFANTETFDGRDLWLPRLAANWKVDPDTVVRGGVGLFGGGSPNVWLSNSFTNDGIGVALTSVTRTTANPALVTAALDNVNGNSVPALVQQQLRSGDGSVNAIDPNFAIPSVWKFNIGVDRTFDLGVFGDDYLFTGEVIYSRVKDAVLWRELRVIPSGRTTPDGRPIYVRRPGVPAAGNDLLLTNTDEGYQWTISAMVAKQFATKVGDFNVQMGYAFNRAKDVNPGTSSLAQSNWDNLATADINNPALATSNYELRHNFTMAAEWSKNLIFEDYKTSISLFGNGRSGRPYSYTFAGNSAVFGDPRQGARQRQLFYVPRDQNDVVLTGGLTWDALNNYIIAQGLDKYRGQIAPRNAFRSPPVGIVDLRITQEIPSPFEGHKGVFTFDIRNLTNLINNNWGRNIQVDFSAPGPFVVPVVEATGISPDGKYIYSGPIRTPTRTLQARQSVWAIQFGVRYEF
jgi:outer membrane receptor for ferrienterochelin and colicin